MAKKILNKNIIGGIVIILSTFLGALITFQFKVKPFTSMLLFFTVPTIYMLLTKQSLPYKKIFASSGVVTGIMIPIDTLINASNGWHVPSEQLFLSWRLFGLAPLEEILWFGSFFLFGVTFYEYYFNKTYKKSLPRSFQWFIYLFFISLLSVLLLSFTQWFSSINYIFLITCSLYMLPPLIFAFISNPKLIKKFILVAIPFFFINLIHEITAIQTGQWVFEGKYVGKISIFGATFPLEEFFFYITIGSITGLAYYEIFVDDMK